VHVGATYELHVTSTKVQNKTTTRIAKNLSLSLSKVLLLTKKNEICSTSVAAKSGRATVRCQAMSGMGGQANAKAAMTLSDGNLQLRPTWSE